MPTPPGPPSLTAPRRLRDRIRALNVAVLACSIAALVGGAVLAVVIVHQARNHAELERLQHRHPPATVIGPTGPAGPAGPPGASTPGSSPPPPASTPPSTATTVAGRSSSPTSTTTTRPSSPPSSNPPPPTTTTTTRPGPTLPTLPPITLPRR